MSPDEELAAAGLAGAEPADAELAGVELADAGRPRVELAGAEPAGAELAGAEPAGAEPAGAELAGAEPAGAELAGAELAGVGPERAPMSRTTEPLIIVGAAIVADGRVLGCERAEPPETAGRWEFPGGKVEPGEAEVDALVRECREELGVAIEVGERVGADTSLANGRAVLRVWLARVVAGEPRALEHSAVRWLGADELDSVPWLPADAPVVAELSRLLRRSSR